MSDLPALPYRQMLHQQKLGATGETGKRKRRKLARNRAIPDNVDVVSISSESDTNDKERNNQGEQEESDSEGFEDVDLDMAGKVSSEDEDDFEDVDLNQPDAKTYLEPGDTTAENDTFTIALETAEHAKKTARRKFEFIPKAEREVRRQIHQAYIVMMIVHGAMRNKWCNDYELWNRLRNSVNPLALELIHQNVNNKVLDTVKSRRFLDGLQKIMKQYRHRFRVTSQGLIRKNWNELGIRQNRIEKNVTFDRFRYLLLNFRGSKDIGAQGFVCLLRSLGLNARLVFSLQPPDYTMTAALPPIDVDTLTGGAGSSSANILSISKDAKQNLLSSIRAKSTVTSAERTIRPVFDDPSYPIFWAEVWNKYSRKWVAIDPFVLETLEVPPMMRKSKFEPTLSETRNQLLYAIAFDKYGCVRDVTRRYSQYYNARTVKKKIHYRSDEDEHWYEKVIRASTSALRRKLNKLDILELKEFYDRDLAEGMPNSKADFKNHPIYALETHLKHNEIIYPKDDTSKCGVFRAKSTRSKKNSEEVIPVYKRSHVYLVRSAKAWYMRGRILKMGVQALKVKQRRATTPSNDGSDTEEADGRLYAEFQTQLYIPPPIIDGLIPKNAFGNIDVYTSSMLPENGYLLDTSGIYTMKMAEQAARILEIDYARAIVAFDFGGKKEKRNSTRIPTAREGGIVIDSQYKEAIFLVLDTLVEEEAEQQRQNVELNTLKNWKYFLIKLRIMERLNAKHGRIDKLEMESPEVEFLEEESASSPELGNDDSDEYGEDYEEVSEEGGFLMAEHGEERPYNNSEDNAIWIESPHPKTESISESHQDDKYNESQFQDSDYSDNIDSGGGFFVEEQIPNQESDLAGAKEYENSSSDGGFLIETKEEPRNITITTEEIGNNRRHESEDLDIRSRLSSEHDSDMDIPDELFRLGNDGELIYDPDCEDTQENNDSQTSSPQAMTPVVKTGKHVEMEQLGPSVENANATPVVLEEARNSHILDRESVGYTEEREPQPELRTCAYSNVPDVGKDVEATNATVERQNFYSDVPDPQQSLQNQEATADELQRQEDEMSSQEKSRLIEQEKKLEQEFGFEYSDEE